MKYLLTIAYDGTHFGGWQYQPNAPSIQETVEEVLTTLLQEKTTLTSSSRTDAGVHALGHTAHFSTQTEINLNKFLFSLNSLLPPSIRIRSLAPVPDTFHARYSAKRKIYHYHLVRRKSPCKRHFSHHPYHFLDKELLKRAASHFIGTHDFTSFAGKAHEGSASKNPVRTLYRLDVIETDDGMRLEFEGDGFLYKMVRNITGTLLDVCAGKIKEEEIPEIFAAKDRSRAGKTAPPHALFLCKVLYDLPREDVLTPSAELSTRLNPSVV